MGSFLRLARARRAHSNQRLFRFAEAASLIIAMPLKQTNQVVALVGVLTFAFGLATLASAIAMTWVIVTRTFEPLARVEQTAAKIAAGDLSQRIEDYNPSNEIGNLAVSLNTMLTQIEMPLQSP